MTILEPRQPDQLAALAALLIRRGVTLTPERIAK